MSRSPRDYATDHGIALHAMDADTLWARGWIERGCPLDEPSVWSHERDLPITPSEYEALVAIRRAKARRLRAEKNKRDENDQRD